MKGTQHIIVCLYFDPLISERKIICLIRICNIRTRDGVITPPPPLGQDNLNDISEALEALNIPSDVRSQIGMSSTDTIADVLVKLNSKKPENIIFGSYVGNGNYSSAHPNVLTTNKPYADSKIACVIIQAQPYDSYDPKLTFAIMLNSAIGYSYYYGTSSTSGGIPNCVQLTSIFSDNGTTLQASWYADGSGASAYTQCNASNYTYSYVIFCD